jgi:hypothetical protein
MKRENTKLENKSICFTISSDGIEKVANKKEDGSSTNLSQDAETGPLLLPSLYRLTEGMPRKELKLMMISLLPACSPWS